jgi:hypothetical protein
VGFFVVALILAALKVLVATSYSGLLLHAPPLQFVGADNGYAQVQLPPPLTNCTHATTFGANGMTVAHQSTNGECVVVVDCAAQCTLQRPEALETLCSMYILGAFYIAYLGYEFHRSLCIDRSTFSLSGRFARIAQSLTPLLRFLPDVAALMKYGLVALTIGVTLTQHDIVRCKDLKDAVGGVVLEVSGADMSDGCNPSVEPLLGSRQQARCDHDSLWHRGRTVRCRHCHQAIRTLAFTRWTHRRGLRGVPTGDAWTAAGVCRRAFVTQDFARLAFFCLQR